MSTTTNLSTLKINYLTQAQYDAALSGGTIDEDQLYLTPDTKVYGHAYQISNSPMSLTATSQKVPLKDFTGNGTSLSSNGIKITEAGIYVISGSAYFTTGFTANDMVHVEVWVNSSVVNAALLRLNNTSYYSTVCVSPFIYSLSANDVVYLYAYNQTGARGAVANYHRNGLTLFKIS